MCVSDTWPWASNHRANTASPSARLRTVAWAHCRSSTDGYGDGRSARVCVRRVFGCRFGANWAKRVYNTKRSLFTSINTQHDQFRFCLCGAAQHVTSNGYRISLVEYHEQNFKRNRHIGRPHTAAVVLAETRKQLQPLAWERHRRSCSVGWRATDLVNGGLPVVQHVLTRQCRRGA